MHNTIHCVLMTVGIAVGVFYFMRRNSDKEPQQLRREPSRADQLQSQLELKRKISA